jgi:hypothetical protein
VPDHRRRSLVPDRLLLPPAPREPALARRWQQLTFEEQRRLGAAAVTGVLDLSDDDEAELVRGLARARVSTAWRLQLSALVLGWLVLMTVWGFGRSTFPADEGAWLVAGLVGGVLAWVPAAIAARQRVRRAARVVDRSVGD